MTVLRFTQLRTDGDGVAATRLEAERAAAGAGVSVSTIDDLDGFEIVRRLLHEVWRPDPGDEAVTRGLLNALVHSGNYCAAAFSGGRPVGASVAFLGQGPDREPLLHSHITAILSGSAGRGVGLAMKLHQRAWAVERGLRVITWTHDPLVRRNAHFNAVKLGALPVEYLVDFYGEMNDAINAGQGSDRLLSRWDLTASRVAAPEPTDPPAPWPSPVLSDIDDRPVLQHDPAVLIDRITGAGAVSVQIPRDIEAMRIADPSASARWRRDVRGTLGALMDAGWTVTAFRTDGGYALHKEITR